MKIVANENVAVSLILALRKKGYDVLSVKESIPGVGDAEVLARAQSESRLVVTHDKDFGELAFRWGLPAASGVILLRFADLNPDFVSRRLIKVLEGREDWTGHFSVVSEDRLRMRPLPEKPA